MDIKEIDKLIRDKDYVVFIQNDNYCFERRVVGKIQNFSSDKIVLFNDEKNEVYIVKYKDINSMLPCLETQKPKNNNKSDVNPRVFSSRDLPIGYTGDFILETNNGQGQEAWIMCDDGKAYKDRG